MKLGIKKSKLNGLGVFANENIIKGQIIEECHTLVFKACDVALIDKTMLYDYYFSWEDDSAAIALGNGSLYNHSYLPNTIYKKDMLNNKIIFEAICDIKMGDEITVNYNGDPNDKSKVWFDMNI